MYLNYERTSRRFYLIRFRRKNLKFITILSLFRYYEELKLNFKRRNAI
jgi:hypothetical protein